MKRKTYQGRPSNKNRGYKRQRTNTGFKKVYGRKFIPRTMGPFSVSESKYADAGIASTAIAEATSWVGTELDPVSGPTNTLFCPVQGTGINERIARRVSLYKLAIRGVVSTSVLQDQVDVVSSPSVRVIVYMDKQTNGIQAQGEDVMALGSYANLLTATTENAFCSFQNIDNFGRFQVLKDITLRPRIVTAVNDGTATSSQNVSSIPFKITLKFRVPVPIRFDSSTGGGSVADIVDNSFHIIANKSGTAFASTMQYICRAYYKDV